MLREFSHGAGKGLWSFRLVILALGVTLTVSCLGPDGSSAAARSPNPTEGQAKVFAGAQQGVEIAPRRIELTGLEGRPFVLFGISWANWGGAKATGRGKVSTVGCGTSCTDPGRILSVRIVLRRLNRSCGRLLYRKAFVFHAGVGQYFNIPCGPAPQSR